jgi:hypothetical protein
MIFYRLGNGESLRWYIGMLYSLEAILKEIMKAETLRATKVFYFYPPRLIPYVHKDNFNREEYIFALKELNILLLASHGKLPAEIYAEVIWLLLAGLSLRALNFNSCIYYP